MRHLLVFVAATLATICEAQNPPATSSFCTHVFHDRSSADYEYVIMVQGEEVLLQRHQFPSYATRQVYYLRITSPVTAKVVKDFCSLRGDMQPPFVPEGVLYVRSDFCLKRGTSVGNQYFSRTNAGLVNPLHSLRADVLNMGLKTNGLPSWVRDKPELMKRLGR